MAEVIDFAARSRDRAEQREREGAVRGGYLTSADFAAVDEAADDDRLWWQQPKPVLAPDDPIFRLHDAFKKAQAIFKAAHAPYDRALRVLAKQHGRPVKSMARIVGSAARGVARSPR